MSSWRRSRSTASCALLAKQMARHNQPPFTVVNDGTREVLTELARSARATSRPKACGMLRCSATRVWAR